MIAASIFSKFIGERLPDILADVETIGAFNRLITSLQKLFLTNLTAIELSSFIRILGKSTGFG